MSKNEFKVLSDREHILQRPSMYIGSTTQGETNRFINGEYKSIKAIQGLLKCVDELIDNAVDEFIRTDKKYANIIKITMNHTSFKVEDNGRGIPVELYQNKYRPVLAWTQCRAGTSFDADRNTLGANGVGSVVANIFSKKFIAITHDGKQSCEVICSDNMSIITHKVKSSKKNGTSVYIEPDFDRFHINGFSDFDMELICSRLYAISAIYPELSFVFNGKKISTKNPKSFIEKFNNVHIDYIHNDYFISIMPSEEYRHYSVINGLDLYHGGTHELYITKILAHELKTLIKRKYKIEMNANEIKSGIMLLTVGKNFNNLLFDSQNKVFLKNSEHEIRKYFYDIPFEKIAKKIMSEPEIIEPIIQTKLALQAAKDARAITIAQKNMKRTKVANHIEANSRNIKETTLFLTEGLSAVGQGRTVRDVNKHGFFPLRGMPLNCFESSQKEILENKEFSNIMTILGLKFGSSDIETIANLKYGTIGILCDADLDALGAIQPLLLNFFKHWPVLFQKERIKFIKTPIYIATKKTDVKYYYSKEEFENQKDKLSGYEIRYIKGLGTLRKHEYAHCINNEQNWEPYEIDDITCFETMFSSNKIDERKKILS